MAKKELCGRCNKPKGKKEGSCKCWRPVKFDNVEELSELIDQYFIWCDNHIEERPNLFYEEELEKYESDLIAYEKAGGESQRDQEDEWIDWDDLVEVLWGKKQLPKKKRKILKPIKPQKVHRSQVSTPYTITWLALWLGTTRELLAEYERKEEFSATIKRAKARVENYAEVELHERSNPTGAIFKLKNFGRADKQEIEQKTTVTLTDEQKKAIEERLSVDEDE